MSSAGWISIFNVFQHGLQDGYLSLNPHVKGRVGKFKPPSGLNRFKPWFKTGWHKLI